MINLLQHERTRVNGTARLAGVDSMLMLALIALDIDNGVDYARAGVFVHVVNLKISPSQV